jgi:hypothetical protein
VIDFDIAVFKLSSRIYQRLNPGGLMLAFTCVHLARSLFRCNRVRDAQIKANTALAILEKFCAKTVKMCGIAIFVTTLVSKKDDEVNENRVGRLCVTMAELAMAEKNVSVAKEWMDQYASLSDIDDEYLVRDKRAIYVQMFAAASSASKSCSWSCFRFGCSKSCGSSKSCSCSCFCSKSTNEPFYSCFGSSKGVACCFSSSKIVSCSYSCSFCCFVSQHVLLGRSLPLHAAEIWLNCRLCTQICGLGNQKRHSK